MLFGVSSLMVSNTGTADREIIIWVNGSASAINFTGLRFTPNYVRKEYGIRIIRYVDVRGALTSL